MSALKIIIFSVTLLLISCSSIGPRSIPVDRLNYNKSMHNSSNQQLLLNILRLRYTDNVFFLSVNSVVAQLVFNRKLTTDLGKVEHGPWGGSAEAAVEFQDKPTITYSPLQGQALVKRFLTPISLKIVYLLLRSGWGINHLLRVLIQKIDHIENAVSASRNVGGHRPAYKKFMALSWVFYKLQYSNNLTIRYGLINKRFSIKLVVNTFDGLNDHERALLREINISANSPYVWLVDKFDSHPHHAHIEARTMLGLMNYLSKGVNVPQSQIMSKQVPMTMIAEGQSFDWRQVTKGMISIKSSMHRPENAYVSIYYKGFWFYILDNDYHSKESFSLLNLLYSFQQGEISQNKPIFTIS